jgi:O-antigen/teichoic acid export membrane protein
MPARIARSEIRKGFDSLPEMIRFGLKTTPGAIADGVSNEVGTWVLGIVASTAAVGAFNRAWLLGRRFVDLQHRVAEILFPTILERRAARDFDGADRVVVDSMRYSTMFLLLPAAVGGGASTAVMSVYGPGFGRASAALGLLLLVPPLAVIGSIQSHMLLAVDRPVASSVSSVGRMVVTVAVCVVLGILFGVSGAALAVLVGYVAEVGWKAYLVKGQLARPVLSLWPLRQWAGLVLAFGAAFVCSRLVSEELFGAAGLLLGLTAGTVVYLAVLFVGGDLSARDRERLTSASVRLRMGYRGLVGRRTVSEAPVGEAE